MKILLIDADSKIPNLALMKLSTFHRSVGDTIELVKLSLPYYPRRKKSHYRVPSGYDKVYCSVVFGGNLEFIHGNNIIFGGTGYDLCTELPEHIENLSPDYSIYPKNNISYGFISRGCIRNCPFCFVPKKEGNIRQVATIDDIVFHKRVDFLDNNILALSNHKDIFSELVERKIHSRFSQGLDIRLLDEENSDLLSKMNYFGEYIFAFDYWKYRNLIANKLELLSWRKDFQLKFYVYIHPNMPLSDTVNRVEWLRDRKLLPYIMRDISCWDSEYKNFYIDLAAYCNQVGIFKSHTFSEYIVKRHTNNNRIDRSKYLYYSNMVSR